MADPNNPLIEGDDIQGNIFPGFRRKGQLLVYYAAPSESALRSALAVLAPRITPLPPVLEHRDARKAAFIAASSEPELQALWTNIALGASALDRLGEKGVRSLDPAFDIGMRPASTGDPWSVKDAQGNPNLAHPSNWKVGSPSEPLDLLVILAFDDAVLAGVDTFLAQLSATGVREIYRDQGVRLSNDSEHFGFSDGISEVGIRGVVEIAGQERFLTTRYGVPPENGVEFGKPGQALVWPGQFLVGAPTGPKQTHLEPEQYRNGSFLVFRRLAQNVRAFQEETAEISRSLAASGRVQSPEQVQAAIVGRWPSGAALMRHRQDPVTADGDLAANYFSFGSPSPDLPLPIGLIAGANADPAPLRGLQCPAFAHIRKVNPRDLPTDKGDAARTRGFQMLRRGIPFGPAYDRVSYDNPVNGEPRGLLFLAYQRCISKQFEQLNSDWMNTDKGPGPGGYDLLVGQRVDETKGIYAEKTAILYDAPSPSPGHELSVRSTWVMPTGGAYLFAPSLSHIRALSVRPGAESPADIQLEPLYFNAVKLVLEGIDHIQNREISRHDGDTQIRRHGGRDSMVSACWPATACLAGAASGLIGGSLDALDLSGEHFPTEEIAVDEALTLARMPELKSLRVDGVTLEATTLLALVRTLDRLTSLNLAGCDIDSADVAAVASVRPSISKFRIGSAPPRQGHRFSAPRLSTTVLQCLEGFQDLRHLGLRGVRISDLVAATSKVWDQLESLDLGETQAGNATAERLAQAPHLQNIDLDQTVVTDFGATALLKGPLISLSLAWTSVSVEGLRNGPSCPSLSRLNLAGTLVDDTLAIVLSRFPNLAFLDVSSTLVADQTVSALVSLRGILELNVARTRISDAGVDQLSRLPIASLHLEGLQVNALSIRHMADSAHLRQLSLDTKNWAGLSEIGSEVSLQAPALIDAPPPPRLCQLSCRGHFNTTSSNNLALALELRSLTVIGSTQGAKFGRRFGSLRDFRAENTNLDDETLSTLLLVPVLEALYISDNPFGERMNSISGEFLHTLELRRTGIDDRAIDAIGRLPRLHCLDVPFTKVTAGGISALVAKARNLQSLALDASQVDQSSVRALSEHSRLLEIYLYGSEVNKAVLKKLARVRIRDLSLVDTGVTDEAVPILAAMPGLRTLRLDSELTELGLSSLQALRPDLLIEATPRHEQVRTRAVDNKRQS